MRSVHELRVRIAELQAAEERLDGLDWMGRQWVAAYAANAATLADCMLELLDGRAALPQPDADAATCVICAPKMVPVAESGAVALSRTDSTTVRLTPGPAVQEIPDLDNYKLSSFLHAEAHDHAGTDFEECADDDCPHWPDPAASRGAG